MVGIETERRFLIKMPSPSLLDALGGDEIVQIYLKTEANGTERVRARTHGGTTTYTHNVKRRISSISAEESEEEIDQAEFERLSSRRDERTSPIIKTRYVLPYRERVFEIDVYAEWRQTAIMEVELPSEDAGLELPPEITVIREVSGNRGLSNHSLAFGFPSEEELLSEK